MSKDDAIKLVIIQTNLIQMGYAFEQEAWLEYADALRVLLHLAEMELEPPDTPMANEMAGGE